MKPRIASIFARLRKPGGNAGHAVSAIAAASQRDDRETARALAAGLDRAMELGLWAHADRIAGTAARIANQHPMLCERMARLRLLQHNPEAALNFLDYCQMRTGSLRLLRAICLLQLGRRIEAHLELREWALKPAAPLAARTLLALLEWHSGDRDAACDALQQNLKQIEDPNSLATLMLMSIADGNEHDAGAWANRLRQICVDSHDADRFNAMMQSLNLPPIEQVAVAATPQHEEFLAAELLMSESVIPALVEAQRLQVNPNNARALLRAIELALPDLEDQTPGYAGIANLHVLLGDQESALRWARLGFERCPMSVTLARLVLELEAQWPDEVIEEAAERSILDDDIALERAA